ncbi:MAG TPA: hypothetical protein VHX14_04575 [Thermoanaerobaculia bacterium]|nr:hypothetical protein [Thermoanaerobaculia bacterium]
MKKKKTGEGNSRKATGSAASEVMPDPAENYYERARANRAEYDRAIKVESPWAEYLAERNSEAFGSVGNPRSRQGFDPGSFRHR